ncbi:MAG: FHA domain-containing protein [Chthonomonas sp.]|nr:FHA domain-containing protein [Chthonomonas sp.]
MADKTQMIPQAPSVDANKTLMGGMPALHAKVDATITIKPVQCPVCKTFNPAGIMFCNECGLIFDRALDGDAFGAPAVQLPVLVDEGGREHFVRPGTLTLGRQGDIALEDGRISRLHAQVTLDGATAWLEDLGSTNGTSINGNKIAAGSKVALNHGEQISLGGYKLTLSLPGETNKTMVAMGGKTQAISVVPTTSTKVGALVAEGLDYPLHKGVNTFGRRDDNAIQLDNKFVSGKHGEIEVTDQGVYLTDTGSTNGTVLNDTKLNANTRTLLQPGDVILLGGIEYRVELA